MPKLDFSKDPVEHLYLRINEARYQLAHRGDIELAKRVIAAAQAELKKRGLKE